MTINDLDVKNMPHDYRKATKYLLDLLVEEINPTYTNIRHKFDTINKENDRDIYKIKDLFILSLSQIKKCMLNFLEILKKELRHNLYLEDTRQFILKRLIWCMSKLMTVEKYLDQYKGNGNLDCEEFNEIINVPMYFVNWIDYTFDVLTKLSETVYKNDYNENTLPEQWKDDIVDHVIALHMCIDELLLSAVTLCKYCLDEDQPILRARCHVVLRETKALFNELVNVDITESVKITQAHLKSPVMPSNVNMLIDVLKDSLYVLETNTNTALLILLIHSYVCSESPVDVLRDHFNQRGKHLCLCHDANTEDADIETCVVVKDFDLYNERLTQIGSFAVSCSSDQKRIVSLRSCLSSLESMDSHLVPAISTDAISPHTTLLMNFWKQELMEIRDTVFLIVDPVAFVERCKTYMKELLMEEKKQDFRESEAWSVIVNVGSLVHDFFSVYKQYEPDALVQDKEFDELLQNLNKAQKECKVVYSLLKSDEDVDVSKKVTIDTLTLRARLLYSLIKKIHELIRPKDDEFFGNELDEDANVNKDMTHTVLNPDSVYSRRRPNVNLTRSIFARTATITKSKRNHILGELTKHLQIRKVTQQELNFSEQVSELFHVDSKKVGHHDTKSMSLRRTLFSQTRSFPLAKNLNCTYNKAELEVKESDDKISNEIASLQISDILNQLNDITDVITGRRNIRRPVTAGSSGTQTQHVKEKFSISILNSTNLLSSSNTTQSSNVTTLERINDLDLVESKIHSLKLQPELETDL